MPGRQETPSAQLGALLLRGHTMLAESCPSCNIPLMRDPSNLQSLCVGCHRSYSQAEVQALNSTSPPPAQQEQQLLAEPSALSGPLHAAAPGAQSSAAAAGPGQTSRPMNGPLTSALARHHRRTTSNGGSSDGAGSPNLLPAQAPVTPAGAAAAGAAAAGAMSPQSTGGSTAGNTAAAGGGAAAAGANGDAAGVQQLAPGKTHSQDTTDADVMQAYQQIRAERQLAEQQQSQQIRQRHQPSPQANGPTAGAAAVQTPRQAADVSQLMADKMLAGWALLGDHCPLCSTPLMRERGTRQVFCIACNLPVRLEQQAPASGASTDRSTRTDVAAQQPQEQEQQQQQQQQQEPHITGAPALDASGTAVAAAAGAEAAGLRALVQPARQSMAQAAATISAAASQAYSKQQVLSELHQALLTKLHEARQHLLAIPTNQHEQMGQQLQLIQQLLQTLAIAQQ